MIPEELVAEAGILVLVLEMFGAKDTEEVRGDGCCNGGEAPLSHGFKGEEEERCNSRCVVALGASISSQEVCDVMWCLVVVTQLLTVATVNSCSGRKTRTDTCFTKTRHKVVFIKPHI